MAPSGIFKNKNKNKIVDAPLSLINKKHD